MAGDDAAGLLTDDSDTMENEEVFRREYDEENIYFDTVIGEIEDIIMDDTFHEKQQSFLEKNYQHFEETDENKLIYTDIFNEYIALIENYINTSLTDRIPGFSMDKLAKELRDRRDELNGEVFDILFSFTDFLVFKEMLLDYKNAKEGTIPDLSSAISIKRLGV